MLLTTTEVAAMLKLSKWQVYELVKERTRTGEVRHNRLPAYRINGSIRFRESDVDSWLTKLTENQPHHTTRLSPVSVR
jgi:predicted DNA-binding transcriptional regulator AlpA